MKKKFLSIFLALVMCLSLLPTAAFAEGTDEHTHTEPAVETAVDTAVAAAQALIDALSAE